MTCPRRTDALRRATIFIGATGVAALLAFSAPAAACTAFSGTLKLDASTSTLTVGGFFGSMGDCNLAGADVAAPCPIDELSDGLYDIELLANVGIVFQRGELHHECMPMSPHRTIGQIIVEAGEATGSYGPPIRPGEASIDPGDSYALCIYDDDRVSGNEIPVTII